MGRGRRGSRDPDPQLEPVLATALSGLVRAQAQLGRSWRDASQTGGRHGLESGRLDRLAAALAAAVGAGRETVEGRHLAQGLVQLAGQCPGLPPLGRHLGGVHEIGVVLRGRRRHRSPARRAGRELARSFSRRGR